MAPLAKQGPVIYCFYAGMHPEKGSFVFTYGIPTEDGIRCPYHGWKFDGAGHCLEQPNEPEGSNFKDKIATAGYPVQEFAGLIWAYMGPLPAPLDDSAAYYASVTLHGTAMAYVVTTFFAMGFGYAVTATSLKLSLA